MSLQGELLSMLLLCCLWVLSEELVGDAGVATLLEVAPLLPISMWIRRSCKSLSGIAALALHVHQRMIDGNLIHFSKL